MISFFKLAIGVVLLVMIMIWFCSYLRRGRHRETPWLRPPTVTPPPPYTVQGGNCNGNCNGSAAAAGGGRHPTALIAYPPPPTIRVSPAPGPRFACVPATTARAAPTYAPDDLPPPYHTVVNMPPPPPLTPVISAAGNDNNAFVPPPYLPPYDGLGKTTSGPT